MYANPDDLLNSMTPFGAALRSEFLLEPGIRFLNHGSFGAPPREVVEAAELWRRRMEANPDRFMREILPGELRHAAGALATRLRTDGENLVLVENATAGVNAVLRSIDFRAGDEILTSDHCYGAVRQAIRYVCARSGARLVEASVPLPLPRAEEIYDRVAERLTPRTRLVVIDHIASPTGLIFPVARLAAAARQRGAQVLVDGAHAPGQIDLGVGALGVDWYVGNCHKWLFTPRGCGFLWAHADAQRDLHPLSISHRYGESLAAEFDWTGTRDFSAWLALPDALAFVERLGVNRMRTYNNNLVTEAARRITAAWSTGLDSDESLHASMIAIRIPERLHGGCCRQADRGASAGGLAGEAQDRGGHQPAFRRPVAAPLRADLQHGRGLQGA